MSMYTPSGVMISSIAPTEPTFARDDPRALHGELLAPGVDVGGELERLRVGLLRVRGRAAQRADRDRGGPGAARATRGGGERESEGDRGEGDDDPAVHPASFDSDRPSV